jgi:hypothetical protein
MNKLSWMLATTALALGGALAPAARAADKPSVDITPYLGYRMGGQFDVDNPQAGSSSSADLQDSSSWGVDFGIYRDATSFYEFLYSQQSTNLDTDDPSLKRVDVKTEYYQLGGTLLYPQDTWFVPYFSLTAGATRFDAQKGGSETKFSGSLGGGLRIPFNENFSMTLGLRGYLTAVSSDSQFFCAGGGGSATCLLKASGSTLFQGEALIGLSASF